MKEKLLEKLEELYLEGGAEEVIEDMGNFFSSKVLEEFVEFVKEERGYDDEENDKDLDEEE